MNKESQGAGEPVIANINSTELTVKTKSAARAYRLLALILVLRPFGNLSLAWGTRHLSQILSYNPLVYIRAMLNPFVALGIVMLMLGLLVRMALLSLADLSFILPLTATGLVVSSFLAKYCLQEDISAGRWIGTLLIFIGTLVVGSTSQKTRRDIQPQE